MELNELWKSIIAGNAGMTEREFIQHQINTFIKSDRYRNIKTGREYYEGIHDIRFKKRVVVDENGNEQVIKGAPNNKIVNNKFDDLVDQKVNFLLAKPIEVKGVEGLEDILDAKWQRKIKYVAMDSLIGGCGYLHPYITDSGELDFKRLRPEQVIPFWADDEHEELDAFIYMYEVEVYDTIFKKSTITKVEFYTPNGVSYWIWKGFNLTPDDKPKASYLQIDGKPYNWQQVPLIAFKANVIEQPLIERVKSLQDALNSLISNFQDCMEEDIRSTILVIKNYDGENLGNFKKNLAAYGVIKVRDRDGSGGGVDKLTIDVNAANYDLLIKLLKDAIIENGRGFDAKDERMGNQPNQMNIHSMYSDIELDANDMELEFQASFQKMMEFVSTYLGVTGKTLQQAVEFIFNRDLPINEADSINNCRNSVGILSTETIVANHPWTKNTDEEVARLKAEQQEQLDYVMGMGDNGEQQQQQQQQQ